MKLCNYIIFLLISYNCIAQDNTVIIKGKVLSSQRIEKVENAFVVLKLERGYSLEYRTDTSGKYEFKFKPEHPATFTVSIASDKNTRSKTHKNGFLASKDIGTGELNLDTEYVKDFTLTPVPYCGLYSPDILFFSNSIMSSNDSLNKIDSTQYKDFNRVIAGVITSLNDNPEIVIELQGHASKLEKNSELLSVYRAQLIKEILVAKGINEKRLLTKGWGNRKLLVNDDMIKKAKTTPKKMNLHQLNQRVIFRLVNWDFTNKNEEKNTENAEDFIIEDK